MTARTVTGNTVLLTGSAQASQTVTFVKRFATISGTVITQHGSTTTTTDASGNFSKALDCPADGSTSWTLVTPDGSEFDFTLPYGDGTSVAVTTLISAPTVNADAVTLLLDGYEPDLGNPGTNGHVLSSTTAGVRSWVAQSGGGAVDSVFGRTGAVAAESGDYAASQVSDDSGEGQANVSDALNSLRGDVNTTYDYIDTHQAATTTVHGGILPEDAGIVTVSSGRDLATTDAGKILECSGTFSMTCPNGLDAGFQCTIVNVGSGTITIAAATTLQSDGTQLATQYTGATVYHRGSNVWLAMGRLT